MSLSAWAYNGRNVLSTMLLSFLNGSSFLQVTITIIKAWMNLNFFLFKLENIKAEIHNILDVYNFDQVGQQKTELPALEHPKISKWCLSSFLVVYLLEGYSK